jgi:CheY-like chemotaxis protein
MGFNAVVVESDPRVAKTLAGGLSSHFHSVHLARSGEDLRERVAKNRPEVVILDMEYSRLADLRNLHHDFPSLPIVCTHRVPDSGYGSTLSKRVQPMSAQSTTCRTF